MNSPIFRFKRAEMKRIYRGFKTECPTGLITEEVFHGIYSRFFPHGGTVTKIDHIKYSSHNNSSFSFRIIYSNLVQIKTVIFVVRIHPIFCKINNNKLFSESLFSFKRRFRKMLNDDNCSINKIMLITTLMKLFIS